MSSVHLACDNAGKTVTCDRCGRSYVCSPSDDLYCTPEGDHSCESCLIGGLHLFTVEVADVEAMGLGDQLATCRYCRLSITRRPGEKHWADASGWELCPKSGLHEPVLAGSPGAPTEVPGNPIEPEPRMWGG